jgi:MerR family transcriptional regulator, thiopeptide resistance regulator
MEYTVKQLADLAGVSRRTLHHYDEIGLLKPPLTGHNRYRYYDEGAMLRLQQILFFRELGLSLKEIRGILDQPNFDVLESLLSHRASLGKRVQRLSNLISTVDNTIEHLTGGPKMSKKQIFAAFSEEQQEEYAQQARERWDPKIVDSSMKLWKSYSPEKKQQVMAEGRDIYVDIQTRMEAGDEPGSATVQDCLVRWHQHMRYFYEPTWAVLRGLGQMYAASPDFRANFEQMHLDLPDFLNDAIQIYTEGNI